ncbi:U-box domain-containing protein 36-like [Miscanthus floridulus]|uniref:U-box domain-containing protein 36-like n=1 Tax=Miscanthus floridulus TaxID=154761 RepID=UPI00345A6409
MAQQLTYFSPTSLLVFQMGHWGRAFVASGAMLAFLLCRSPPSITTSSSLTAMPVPASSSHARSQAPAAACDLAARRDVFEISCEKVIIEKDDVAKGLEELIAHYGIAKLVVGAAADECYSKQGGRNIFATPPSPGERVLAVAARLEANVNIFCAMKKILHQREIKMSQAAQELLLRGRQKVQEILGQLEAVYSELDDAQELKQQITELNRARKAQEEQLAASKCILEILEADKLELQRERDAALTEAEDLRRKSRVSASDDAPAPSHFVCPINHDVMEDPHIAADGFTYEGEAIRAWLSSGRDTSSMTNLRLAHNGLTPNRALRSAILEWEQERRQHRWKPGTDHSAGAP